MEKSSKSKRSVKRSVSSIPVWAWIILLPVWTYASFWIAQIIVGGLLELLVWAGVDFPGFNRVLLVTVVSAIVYVFSVIVVIGIPLLLFKRKTTNKEVGLNDWPAWMDILLSVPAYIVYAISSGVILLMITSIVSIDLQQTQALPFEQSMLGTQSQFLLAFLTLVVIAPFAEELLYRGYLYGKLRKVAPIWATVIATALAFGAAHLWTGGEGGLQWVVAIDTFALGIILSLLREYTGAIWAGVLVHSIKNGIAFYFLFVNPQMFEQLKAGILPFL